MTAKEEAAWQGGPNTNNSNGNVADSLSWLGRWLAELLQDGRLEEQDLRVAIALAVIAIRRNALTASGFDVSPSNAEIAAVAGIEP